MPLYVFECPNSKRCGSQEKVEVLITDYFEDEADASEYAETHKLKCGLCETQLSWNPFGGSSSFRLNFKPS